MASFKITETERMIRILMTNRLANGTGLVLLALSHHKAIPFCALQARTKMGRREIFFALKSLTTAELAKAIGKSGQRVYVITESGREMLAR